MRTTRDALNFRVMVRRVGTGAAPFGWEVRNADTVIPVSTSAKRFRGMEAAYKDGQEWLATFLTKLPTVSHRKRGRPAGTLQPSSAEALLDEEDEENSADPAYAAVEACAHAEEASLTA
jgi:hypothetical protein